MIGWPGAGLLALAGVFAAGATALTANESQTPTDLYAARPPALTEAFRAAHEALGPDYQPNTHLRTGSGAARHTNRLILEASPYLLQHAHNPVDWYPWSEEAFARARRENRPVFLSVGYATCHWCHVMEEESFDNEDVARVLNAGFVAIKIDREARPDLDHTYMLTTQLMTGHGGWPNTLFLMPDGRPFHAGTYFPKPQLLQLLNAVSQAWTGSGRSAIETQAAQLANAVVRISARQEPPAPLGAELFRSTASGLQRAHNAFDGGFSQATQFPQETWLLFLLDHWRRTGDPGALAVATRSLRAIAAGGIHDHVGGGFHRYTVDVNWRTPHFEKMLYNQALLSRAFLEAHAATGDAVFARAAARTFDYVIRDLTESGGVAAGAFHAAEDADSLAPSGKREEGYFYVWTPDALHAALGADDAETATQTLGINRPATLEHGAVAHLDPQGEADLAALSPVLESLRLHREQRPRPRRDDKVIGDWNGMMIRALAEGAVWLEEPRYAQAAAQAADAVWTALDGDAGKLCRFHARGRAEGAAQLGDFANLGLGFLALADATRDPGWQERARFMAGEIETRFADASGRLRQAQADGPLGPSYDADDGATPSGESAALELLARLSERGPDPVIRSRAESLRDALSGTIAAQPLQRASALTAAATLQDGDSTAVRSIAHGHGRATARYTNGTLRLEVVLDPDWHVNSDQPLHADLIATTLEAAEGPPPDRVLYPAPVRRVLGFTEGDLALFEGTFDIQAEWDPAPDSPLAISLTLQPCSDRICLAPETFVFRVR